MPPRHRRPQIPALAGLTALLALAPSALGASVTLTGASPTNGLVVPTQAPPYVVTFQWTADLTGCNAPATGSTAQLVVTAPDGSTLPADPVTGNPPNGLFTLNATPTAPATYQWYVRAGCPAAPGGEMRSETRSFTLTGPDPSPRLNGTFRVDVAGSPQTWTFTARCPTGACDVGARRPGSKNFKLTYNPATRSYSGVFPVAAPASERVCTVTRRLKGVIVSRRTYRNVYSAETGTVKLSVRTTAVDAGGTQTLATGLVGTQRARYVANARGTRLGCPSGSFAVATLTAQTG